MHRPKIMIFINFQKIKQNSRKIICRCSLALRVPPVVTRLTVHRWLHIPARSLGQAGRPIKSYGLATFGVAVLGILLFVFNENLRDQINRYDLDFHQGASLYIHCAWRTACRGACFIKKITRCSRKIKKCKRSCSTSSLAVTRLTVYRQLQILEE